METPLKFQTYSDKSGLVVSPGAWIFHKSLTFKRRNSPSKLLKDLYGIWYVATQLGNFSEQAIVELHILSQKHPAWFKTLQNNLHNWIENAAPIEWSKLEAQDPYGRLKRLNFERIIKSLTTNKITSRLKG